VSATAGTQEAPTDWMTEGPFEMAEGIFRLPLPIENDGLRGVNVYALECDKGLILIDSGVPDAASRATLERGLNALGAGLSDVAAFLVTHAHSDHYTQAIALRREFGTQVLLGADEKPSLDAVHRAGRTTLQTQLELLRRLDGGDLADDLIGAGIAGRPVNLTDWGPPDAWIEPDRDFELLGVQLSAVATPGHTRGHLCFVESNAGVVFTGDHVLPHITPSLGLEPSPTASPLLEFMSSLERLLRLPDVMMLPAHGLPAEGVHARVEVLLAHHHGRLEACIAAVGSGARSTCAVAAFLPWTSRGRNFRDLSQFDQMLATLETETHLDVLVSTGRLVRENVGLATAYALAGARAEGRSEMSHDER
jgi:glyoxylase-like metal-dependent hydrolase (beta-lactamase superfamily II)